MHVACSRPVRSSGLAWPGGVCSLVCLHPPHVNVLPTGGYGVSGRQGRLVAAAEPTNNKPKAMAFVPLRSYGIIMYVSTSDGRTARRARWLDPWLAWVAAVVRLPLPSSLDLPSCIASG